MSGPIAERVVSRFLKAAGSPDKRIEAGAHRAQEMLRALTQQHGFWMRDLAEKKPAPELNRAFQKILSFMKTYEHEVASVMEDLEEAHYLERETGTLDYPDSYERAQR